MEGQSYSIKAAIPRLTGRIIGEWETNGTFQGASGMSNSTAFL